MRRAGFGTTSLVTVRLISMTNSRELSPESISFDSWLQTYRQSRLFILAGLPRFATEGEVTFRFRTCPTRSTQESTYN
jgi:hypothetical protein